MAEPYRSKGARKLPAKLGSIYVIEPPLQDSFQKVDSRVLGVIEFLSANASVKVHSTRSKSHSKDLVVSSSLNPFFCIHHVDHPRVLNLSECPSLDQRMIFTTAYACFLSMGAAKSWTLCIQHLVLYNKHAMILY